VSVGMEFYKANRGHKFDGLQTNGRIKNILPVKKLNDCILVTVFTHI
jgi:hypothetical protein